MRGNNGIKFFLVIALIAVLTYICFAGNLFGIKIPGAMDIVPGIDINGGIDATLYAVTDNNRKPTQKELDTAKVIIGKRLDKEGILDRDLSTDVANGRIVLRIPYAKGETNFDPEATMTKLVKTALLTFQEVDESKRDANRNPTYDESKIILGGTDVIDATPQKNPDNGGMQVELKFNSAGQKKFSDATARLIGKQIAIFMDDQFISEAQVQTHITSGDARITLGTSSDNAATAEAKDLADTIRSGALPFKLTTESMNSISPLLGKGALDITIKAFIVAYLLIAFFMIFYYRLPGLIASIALFALAIMTLLAISWLNITMTISGLAGVVLAVGMGVDANVIIFERIKEEMRAGKTLKAAIDLGFKRALAAIIDGNVTTLIVAVIMGYFGTGIMISFAYTLFAGVLISFFTAITLTKTMLNGIAGIDAAKRPWLYGI